ncbi:MAG: hypothetical protein LBG74_04070 [Spirochaetaceae bacterium]|jgi:hypothetical protein|nr:hypothetical protein [Spirochaetaceae bacterium]
MNCRIGQAVILLSLLCLYGCKPKMPETPPQPAGHGNNVFPHTPQAVIMTGKTPLWFEFAPLIPNHLKRVEDAALNEFSPWPVARHATGLLPFENGLAAAVNRYGFLAVLPDKPGKLLFYAFEETEWFPGATASIPFYFDGRPTVILSGHDFFLEAGLPPPLKQFFALVPGESLLTNPLIPAFEQFAGADGWDIETFFPTAQGWWYFKARNKSTQGKPANHYYRAEASGVSQKIDEVGEAAFYEAFAPLKVTAVSVLPPLVNALLVESGVSQDGNWHLTLFTDTAGKLAFSGAAAKTDGTATPLYAMNAGDDYEQSVLLVSERGAAPAAVFYYGGNAAIKKQALPILPENFFWTGAGCAGGNLIAFWEERDNWNIGAAGFMIVKLEQ